MKSLIIALLSVAVSPCLAQMAGMQTAPGPSQERLGRVSFATSCAVSQAAAFNRGVALLHDFWYEQAEVQFAGIAKADPACAMAYWGEAMAQFHQIWERPDAGERAKTWRLLNRAPKHATLTPREQMYMAALAGLYKPDERTYQVRIEEYSAAMGALYAQYPADVDAGAFYALSLLAATAPKDDSLQQNRKALAVLTPLFEKAPDNPGVDHYIVHACDTPLLAKDGLAAANHYGQIAPDGAHAVHMPGHIYARLGMWPQDIVNNEQAVVDAKRAQANHTGSPHDQLHAEDFLVYAYLQSGNDEKARATIADAKALMVGHEAMGGMSNHGMGGLFPYYETELPMIYTLELRDWRAAAALQVVPDGAPTDAMLTHWARAIGAGHLHNAAQASDDLQAMLEAIAAIRKSTHPELAEGSGTQIRLDEANAWVAYAGGHEDQAVTRMRGAADLQDKVGQGEVDIPAREMLADMLLAFHQPQQALVEYERALVLSPNRFNALYHAGMAAEAAGEKSKAAAYYAQLVKQTDGSASSRPELAHARSFGAASQVAER